MTAADQIVRSVKKVLAMGGRPHMARLIAFNRLIWPSVCPLLLGSSTAFRTASKS